MLADPRFRGLPIYPFDEAGAARMWLAGFFVSLFLVIPFLLANTGTAGFLVGFIASLLPLSVPLPESPESPLSSLPQAVSAIERPIPSPERWDCCLSRRVNPGSDIGPRFSSVALGWCPARSGGIVTGRRPRCVGADGNLSVPSTRTPW